MRNSPLRNYAYLCVYASVAIGSATPWNPGYALTPDEARENYIWQGFQSGPDHKGHIPVDILVDNTPTKVEDWPMRALLTHSMATGSEYILAHSDGVDYSADGYVRIHQNLNQPTVVDDALVITNRGYATPFVITHFDRVDNTISVFDYLDQETVFENDANGDFLDDQFCTISQSQAVYEDNIAYLTTNYYRLSTEDRLCDPTVDIPDEQFTHLRAHPIQRDKESNGTEGLELVIADSHKLLIGAHHKDQFLSPAIFGTDVYSQGGGLTSSRDHTGVYSYANTGSASSITVSNNWATINEDGYIKLAPNSLWAPAVNATSVFTFLNGSNADDYAANRPTMTKINRSTGEVSATTIDSIDFVVTDESSFNVFNMSTAPVLADSNTLVVINNGNLIFIDVADRQFTAAPVPINGDFYGQPVVANGVVYALSRDQAVCSGETCIKAISVTSKSPVKDSGNVDNWVWNAPGATEVLEFPFVATNSHLFLSSDAGNTYGVTIGGTNAARSTPDMTYPLAGELAFAYDTLFIAHSANDVALTGAYADLQIGRPLIASANVGALNAALISTWANHDSNITAFTDTVKNNNASVVVALQFDLDPTKVADLDVDLNIFDPATIDSGSPVAYANPANEQVEVDEIITYQAVITNRGALDATTVVATITIPGAVQLQPDSFTFVDAAGQDGDISCSVSGAIVTCELTGDAETLSGATNESATFTFQVIPKVISRIDMKIAVDASELNPDSTAPADDTDDNNITTTITSIEASPSTHDLSVTVEPVGNTTVDMNRSITYRITATNASSAGQPTNYKAGLDVRINFSILSSEVEEIISVGNCSSDNCTIERLEPGTSQTFDIVTSAVGPGRGGLNVNILSTRAESDDLDFTNNSDSYLETTVRNQQTAESAAELPRAGGGLSRYVLLFLLVLTAYRNIHLRKAIDNS